MCAWAVASEIGGYLDSGLCRWSLVESLLNGYDAIPSSLHHSQ